nr:hypothetical protein 81 [bacterium]
MIEIIVAFLLERGGVFGFLFLLSLAYIWWTGRGKAKDDDSSKKEVTELLSKCKEVVTKVGELKSELEKFEKEQGEIKGLLDDLWEWHSIKDADGVPIWYVRRSLEESIQSLSNTIKADADRLAQYSKDISKLNEDRVEELKEIITNYNKTILDLTIALEKVRMTLETKGVTDER